MTDDEYATRVDLACAYRLFGALGWHELIYNHITARVPGEASVFLINPFGYMYREITASSLVKVDISGRIVDDCEHAINPAGFVVHAAVHSARADAHWVMHTHTTTGMAVASQRDGLLPLSFPSGFFADRIGYHDLEGITLDTAECARLAADLGQYDVMILRNHGLLACGLTAGDAFAALYHLQRACDVQIAAQGAPLNLPDPAVMHRMAGQYAATAKGSQNGQLWAAMRRWMDDIQPGYAA
jgi:ribulose-5-phosphate 4-epimerase/fuculose-1-phosphate aldolase